jgi:DNA-binding NarL/FixJ family response regulator
VTRVLIVDDHPMVLTGLSAIVSSVPGVEVVGTARDGESAIACVDQLRPDIVVMDLSMPGLGGVEATRRIAGGESSAQVLVLTSTSDDQTVAEAFGAGAVGYVLKDSPSTELMRAVQAIVRNESPVDSRVARGLIRRRHPPAQADVLTHREGDVLRLLARGLSNKAIAAELGVRETTVKTHLSSAFARIGVTDRTAAALWGRDHLPT